MKKLVFALFAFLVCGLGFGGQAVQGVDFSNAQSSASIKLKITADEYWLSQSGVRHNQKCKYFKNCKGRTCTQKEGKPCKICGG